MTAGKQEQTLAATFLPVFDSSDELSAVVDAEPAATWAALMDADLLEVGRRAPLAGMLGGLRVLPGIVTDLAHGKRPPGPPERLGLRDMTELPAEDGGWVLLGERPGETIALGLVGTFWTPVIRYADVTAEAFRDFAEPGFAKTVYALSVGPLHGHRSTLSAVMRTATTDEHARRWFRRYWTFGVGSGAHVVVNALLDLVREEAERA